jgi:predicted trehalose synthase
MPSSDDFAVAAALEPAAVAGARWFAGKSTGVKEIVVVDAIAPAGAGGSRVVVASIGGDLYSVPLSTEGEEALPTDPLWPALARLSGAGELGLPCEGRWLDPDQSHTSVVLAESLVVKLYRRLTPGPQPEAEVLAALTIPEVPSFRGALVHRLPGGAMVTLCLLQDLVPVAESGWDAFVERVVGVAAEPERLEAALEDAAVFGAGCGRLHAALVEQLGTEPLLAPQLAGRQARAEESLDEALHLLGGDAGAALAEAAPRLRADLALYARGVGQPGCRLHGDLHLGQFLRRHDGTLAVVDFEGEPGRSLEDRRARWTPMWDLATLLLSFENAAAAARRRVSARDLDEGPLDAWVAEAPARARLSYEETPGAPPVQEALLRASLAEKQVSELLYAVRQLPEWLYAPLEVLRRRWT